MGLGKAEQRAQSNRSGHFERAILQLAIAGGVVESDLGKEQEHLPEEACLEMTSKRVDRRSGCGLEARGGFDGDILWSVLDWSRRMAGLSPHRGVNLNRNRVASR
jgi:hypothetical protein